MRILVLEHEADTPAGLFDEWAAERGHELELLHVPALTEWPDITASDAIVSLGSDLSVERSPEPWIQAELEFLRAAHEADTPLLGICFGGQAVSKALGGEVSFAPALEVAWRRLEVSDGERPISPGPWFFWHEDQFTLPRGAQVLAGDHDRLDAFACGRSVGLQFHPEASATVIHGWITTSGDRLAEGAGERLDAESQSQGPSLRERAFELFDQIAARWAANPPQPQATGQPGAGGPPLA
jgi:GMP synthase-like glutamine amidotransferase